jgi:hypothetical protein
MSRCSDAEVNATNKIYMACHNNYSSTLRDFYSQRKRMVNTKRPNKKSNTPDKTSKKRTMWERTMQFFSESLRSATSFSVVSFLMSPSWGKAAIAAGGVAMIGVELVQKYFTTKDIQGAIKAAASVAAASIDDPPLRV